MLQPQLGSEGFAGEEGRAIRIAKSWAGGTRERLGTLSGGQEAGGEGKTEKEGREKTFPKESRAREEARSVRRGSCRGVVRRRSETRGGG